MKIYTILVHLYDENLHFPKLILVVVTTLNNFALIKMFVACAKFCEF